MPKIKLNKVHCTLPYEIDKDEMYLKHGGKKIWPKGTIYYRMDTGDLAIVDLTMEVEDGWTEIELWDFDYLSLNDFLGTFRFKVDDDPGHYSNSMDLVEKKQYNQLHFRMGNFGQKWQVSSRQLTGFQ